MANTTFVDYTTPVVASWLNDVNLLTYTTSLTYGLKANPLSQFAVTTSAQLAGVISDETGTGSLVFNTSPALITPNLGTPTALVGTNITGTAAGLSIGGNAATATNATNATNLLNTAGIRVNAITATVEANALTIGIASGYRDFTDPTTGIVTTINAAPANIVIPSGATLGFTNNIQSRVVVLEIATGGLAELAVVNQIGGNNLDETTLITTTAITTASNVGTTIYSTTARTNVPFRVVGFIDITEAVAGTWATAPTTIQGTGGQALAALSSLGYGQTWVAVTRTQNTPGRAGRAQACLEVPSCRCPTRHTDHAKRPLLLQP